MKTDTTEPAFSTLSICFLLIAVASALASMVTGYESIRPVADCVGGISALALVASLINDARK
jgi:hypothetical protein